MSLPSGELVPDAIDALAAIADQLKTGGGLAAVGTVRAPDVLDGVDVAAVSGCYLAVGIDGEDDIAGSATMAQAGLGGPQRRDVAAVTCLAYASGGNTDLQAYRAAAYVWYRALRSAIEADPRLGGAVTFAEVVSAIYRPKRSGSAAGVGVEFRVQVTAV